MKYNFDEQIDRQNTHSMKWDNMEKLYGVSPKSGISMWVADMDFRPPKSVEEALEAMKNVGVYGYFGDDRHYRSSVCEWMEKRHDWMVQPHEIRQAHGLVNGISICLEAFTEKSDGVMIFTPVYHAFARVINAMDRRLVECPLALDEGRYVMDIERAAQLADGVKLLILCSPHNPGGRVWSQSELEEIMAFCTERGIIIISDEIHHDLVFEGHKHHCLNALFPDADNIVTLAAATKSFNIAASLTGNIITQNEALRNRIEKICIGWAIAPNGFGAHVATAAYAGGEAWLKQLLIYLDGNRQIFDKAIASIPGLRSMPLEATYLAWVDFSDTGMSSDEFTKRVIKDAQIAANYGHSFGKGGENYLRFNFATPRARILDACERLQNAFADLQ